MRGRLPKERERPAAVKRTKAREKERERGTRKIRWRGGGVRREAARVSELRG